MYSWKTASPSAWGKWLLRSAGTQAALGPPSEFFGVGLWALHLTPADGDHLDTCKGKGGVGAGTQILAPETFLFSAGCELMSPSCLVNLSPHTEKALFIH